MKPACLAIAGVLCLMLSACGVPDLIAHGVKSYERTQDKANAYDAETRQSQPAVASPAQQAPAPDSQPITVEPLPAHSTVVAEPLP